MTTRKRHRFTTDTCPLNHAAVTLCRGKMHCINRCVRLSISKYSGRCLSTGNARTKLFIGGLSYDTNETVLKHAFGQLGEIVEVKVICDHVSGKSRGYGFVQFTSQAAASAAIKEMDGQLLDGRNIRVHYAHKG